MDNPVTAGHIYIHVNNQKFRRVLKALENIKSLRRLVVGADLILQNPVILEDAVRLQCEIMVDLRVAETAVPAALEAVEGKLPWAPPGGLPTPAAFREALPSIVEAMVDSLTVAQATVVDGVLAPSHLLTKASPEWLEVDIDAFTQLLRALQERQASRIAVDYLLITTHDCLQDKMWRREVIEALKPVPYQNLWLRVGGIGCGREELLPSVLDALGEFRDLGRPVIVDAVGGLFGLLLLACGGADAIAHGPASREKCNLDRLLNKPSKPGGLSVADLYVRDLSTFFKPDQWHEFFDHDNIKQLYSCTSTGCCATDEAVLRDRIGHFLRQRAAQHDELIANGPDSGKYFTGPYLSRAAGRASAVSQFTFSDPTINETLGRFHATAKKLMDSLGLHRNGTLRPAPPHRALPGREGVTRLYPEPRRPARQRAADQQIAARPASQRDPDTPDFFEL